MFSGPTSYGYSSSLPKDIVNYLSHQQSSEAKNVYVCRDFTGLCGGEGGNLDTTLAVCHVCQLQALAAAFALLRKGLVSKTVCHHLFYAFSYNSGFCVWGP